MITMETHHRVVDLVLIATTTPRRINRALLELGDTLYVRDPEVRVIIDDMYPLLYVFSRCIDPWTVFRLVVDEPLSSLERVVPVEAIATMHIRSIDDIEAIASLIERRLSLDNIRASDIYVEIKPRKYHITLSEKKAIKEVNRILAINFNIRPARQARYVVKIEDSRYGIVVSVMKKGSDRLSFWRRSALRQRI